MFRTDPLRDPEPLIRRVYSYAAYRLGPGPDAEDATNDTFEQALRYRDSYDRRKGEPVAWLLGIARHCVDRVLTARLPLSAELEEAASTEDVEEEAIRRLTVEHAVMRLDERARELIALRYGADLTAAQIAGLLGERTNTIEVALHRALTRLHDLVGAEAPAREFAVRV